LAAVFGGLWQGWEWGVFHLAAVFWGLWQGGSGVYFIWRLYFGASGRAGVGCISFGGCIWGPLWQILSGVYFTWLAGLSTWARPGLGAAKKAPGRCAAPRFFFEYVVFAKEMPPCAHAERLGLFPSCGCSAVCIVRWGEWVVGGRPARPWAGAAIQRTGASGEEGTITMINAYAHKGLCS
jgi:hypothetical protein